jgi:maleylacetoacetate isomerase
VSRARLYSYWRSSAAYRVRIAVNLKSIDHELVPVSLVKDGGEQRKAEYRAINPQGFVPFYDDGTVATGQSLAIMEYLEETHPEPPLLPRDAADRARVRAFANLVCCDIHPINNLRVMQYLERELGADQQVRDDWYRHWMREGFAAAEVLAARATERGEFVLGGAPTMADVCLVPQMYNARRLELSLDAFPRLVDIDAACRELEAFVRAAPERQADAV